MPRWRNSCLPVGRGIRVPTWVGITAKKLKFQTKIKYAQMAELVYAPVLGTGSRKGLEVRVLSQAQILILCFAILMYAKNKY